MEGSSGAPEEPTAVAGGGAAGTPAACRWNPTKEQISMLENLYGQGLRTPTAEQIQEITSTLQTYGHIEGKNVFYWFQNHKARQRQKQKQDHLSFFHQYHHHRHHHHHQPLLPLPRSPNVVCEPCYVPQNTLGFYAQHLQARATSTITNTSKRKSPGATKPRLLDGVRLVPAHRPESGRGNGMVNVKHKEIACGNNQSHQETLDLFPLHPTGILQDRGDTRSRLASSGCTSSCSGGAVDQPYFDFFS